MAKAPLNEAEQKQMTNKRRIRISKNAASIGMSAILRVKEQMEKQKSADFIDCSVGEADFDSPEWVKMAAVEAIHNNKTRYTGSGGITQLREDVAMAESKVHNLPLSKENVCIVPGAKSGLFLSMLAGADKGDHIVCPVPGWPSYFSMAQLLGLHIATVPTYAAEGFALTRDRLEAAITPKTRWLLLNYPNNPTGHVLSVGEMQIVVEILEKYPWICLLSDEIYARMSFGEYVSLLRYAPSLFDRCIVINGFSKSWSMTGWRIGYVLGPTYFIDKLIQCQSHTMTCPNSFAQEACLKAIEYVAQGKTDPFCVKITGAMQSRANALSAVLSQSEALDVVPPCGGMYLYVVVSRLIGKRMHTGKLIKDDTDLAAYLVEEAACAAVPGSAFDAPEPALRFSLSKDEQNLVIAGQRILQAIARAE